MNSKTAQPAQTQKTQSKASGGTADRLAGYPPQNWRRVKLGDNHIDLISGFAFRSKNFLSHQEKDSLPVIKIKNVANGDVNFEKVVFHFFNKSLEKYKLSQGNILIAMTGNHPEAMTQVVGAVAKYKLKTEALLNQRVGRIITRGNNNLEFFYYFFKNKETQRYLADKSSGSANQANISKDDIFGLEVSIPEPIEQKAIAEVLSSLDDKIDLLHRQNKTLEDMAQALFRKWFIEPTAQPSLNPSQREGDDEADEGWEVGKLGDVVEIFDSKRVPLSKMQRDKMKEGKLYPYYGAAQIMDYVNDYIFDGQYVLIAEDGTVKTDESYPVLQFTRGKFWVNNHTHVLRAKKPYNNFFLWHFLLKHNMENVITGAVQPKINQTNLNSIDFPKFPQEKVEEFQNKMKPTFEKIFSNQSQIRTLENMRDLLLPKLMSGEIIVNGEL